MNLRAPLLSIFLAILLAPGCNSQTPLRRIALATTTSVDNSGLLTVLLPAFREQTGIEADLVTPGSGIALQMLKRGDVDVVISHAPARETELLRHTGGWFYRKIMFNDFVIVGPLMILQASSRLAPSNGQCAGSPDQAFASFHVAIRPAHTNVNVTSGLAQALRRTEGKSSWRAVAWVPPCESRARWVPTH